MGIPLAERAHLGRWAIDPAEGYVRTTRAVVGYIQEKVERALRTGYGGPDIFDEDSLLYARMRLQGWMYPLHYAEAHM